MAFAIFCDQKHSIKHGKVNKVRSYLFLRRKSTCVVYFLELIIVKERKYVDKINDFEWF